MAQRTAKRELPQGIHCFSGSNDKTGAIPAALELLGAISQREIRNFPVLRKACGLVFAAGHPAIRPALTIVGLTSVCAVSSTSSELFSVQPSMHRHDP